MKSHLMGANHLLQRQLLVRIRPIWLRPIMGEQCKTHRSTLIGKIHLQDYGSLRQEMLRNGLGRCAPSQDGGTIKDPSGMNLYSNAPVTGAGVESASATPPFAITGTGEPAFARPATAGGLARYAHHL